LSDYEDSDYENDDADVDEVPETGDALAQLIGLLVDSPDDLEVVEEAERSGDRSYRVNVAADDLGKVIGRQGRTARALRSFLEVRGALDGQRYELEIR
jgi:hypothetical protein